MLLLPSFACVEDVMFRVVLVDILCFFVGEEDSSTVNLTPDVVTDECSSSS